MIELTEDYIRISKRGRVYFDKAEVKDYNKTNKIEQLKFGTGLKKVRKEIA
jgi:hypothetical protein